MSKGIKFFTVLFMLFIATLHSEAVKIVVLGSSTAAGSGPVDINNSWVRRYSDYLRSLDVRNSLVNLAKGGYLTFHAMPTDYIPPAGITFMPDSLHNITKALTLLPDAIIINFPSNDISNGISIDQQIVNYNTMIAKAKEKNVPVWICTSQPVNYGTSQASRDKIKTLKLRIQTEYKNMSIDFYNGLCDSTGKILTQYDSGDGLHLNDAAHGILYERVLNAEILKFIGYNPESETNYLQHPVLIDFGADISPAPWNNITATSLNATGSKISDLIDSTGSNTGLSLEVSKSFYGLNSYGATITFTNLNMPATVSSDNFFTGGGFGQLLMSGLSNNQSFTFTFFGSRTDIGGPSRETKFTVRGTNTLSGLLETRNNSTSVLTMSGVIPAQNKSVIIEVTDGPGNLNASKYSHISALKVAAEQVNAVTENTINPFIIRSEKGKLNVTFEADGQLDIYNLCGVLIYSRKFTGNLYEEHVISPESTGIVIALFKSAGKVTVQKVCL